MAKQRLADLDCTAFRFQPGDRVLVKVKVPLDQATKERLRRIISKWAGDIVEVLVLDDYPSKIEIEVISGNQGTLLS